MYLPGIDEVPPDLGQQSEHVILMTTRLAHRLSEWMNTAADLIADHRDRFLDYPDQWELDQAVRVLRIEASGLSILALDEDAKAPIAGYKMWRH